MNTELYNFIEAAAKKDENQNEDGSVNWGYVDADVHTDFQGDLSHNEIDECIGQYIVANA